MTEEKTPTTETGADKSDAPAVGSNPSPSAE